MKLDSLPRWFHRANWAGGALACFGLALVPLGWWGASFGTLVWALVWLVLGAGAADNARRGVDSLGTRARLGRLRRGARRRADPPSEIKK